MLLGPFPLYILIYFIHFVCFYYNLGGYSYFLVQSIWCPVSFWSYHRHFNLWVEKVSYMILLSMLSVPLCRISSITNIFSFHLFKMSLISLNISLIG